MLGIECCGDGFDAWPDEHTFCRSTAANDIAEKGFVRVTHASLPKNVFARMSEDALVIGLRTEHPCAAENRDAKELLVYH